MCFIFFKILKNAAGLLGATSSISVMERYYGTLNKAGQTT